jgi:hypothetical protein
MKIRSVALSAVLALLAAPSLAVAQPRGAADDVRAAVTLAHEAKQKYDRGDWAGALELFEAAEAKAHSPVLLLYVARCRRNLGQLLRARDVYTHAAGEKLPPGAPEPFHAARADAQRDLDVLSSRIPKVFLRLAPSLPAHAELELDGASTARDRLSGPIEVDPGEHVARVVAGGREISRASFRAEEGKTITVQLEPASARSAEGGAQPEPARGGHLWGIVVTSLGVTGLGAGIATRVMAFDKVSDVKSRCTGVHCLRSDASEVATAETLQTASTVCLVAGGALAAAGVALLVVRPGSSATKSLALRASPSWIGVTGAF